MSWAKQPHLGNGWEEVKHFVARRSSFVLRPGDPSAVWRPEHTPVKGSRHSRGKAQTGLMSKGCSDDPLEPPSTPVYLTLPSLLSERLGMTTSDVAFPGTAPSRGRRQGARPSVVSLRVRGPTCQRYLKVQLSFANPWKSSEGPTSSWSRSAGATAHYTR